MTIDASIVGKYLYSTCGAITFGRVVGVDVVSNTVDIHIYDTMDVVSCMLEDEDGNVENDLYECINDKYYQKQCIAKNIVVESYTEAIAISETTIVLDPPWQGCYRCVCCFWIETDMQGNPKYVDDPNPASYKSIVDEIDKIIMLA